MNPFPPEHAPDFNRRVLVIDPDAESRHAILIALRDPEHATPAFDVTVAGDMDEAIRLVAQARWGNRPFAAAFVGFHAPGGLAFLREAWEADPSLQAVLVTDSAAAPTREIERAIGASIRQGSEDAWDILPKPFAPSEAARKARRGLSARDRREREVGYLERLRRQQEQLSAMAGQASLGQVASQVGHEFGNILQPLLANLELTRLAAPSSLHGAFDDMIDSAELGALICRDLLDLGMDRATNEPAVPVAVAVRRAIRLLGHRIKRKDARLETELADAFEVRVPGCQLAQALVNLLGNSLDSLPDGGRIRVHGGDAPDGSARITVEDTGSGIELDHLPFVFDPYFTTKGSRGRGLGLAITRRILEASGASITLHSEGVGRGTRAVLDFPPR